MVAASWFQVNESIRSNVFNDVKFPDVFLQFKHVLMGSALSAVRWMIGPEDYKWGWSGGVLQQDGM